MKEDRDIAPTTSTVPHVRAEMSEPMLTEYSYQAEPTTGLASVQIPLPEKVGIQANLLAGAVWK